MHGVREKLVVNEWVSRGDHERAQVIRHDVHPEGLDVSRYRFHGEDSVILPADRAHLLSFFAGEATLAVGESKENLSIRQGVHIYLPAGMHGTIHGQAGSQLVLVSANHSLDRCGQHLIVRDEKFLRACTTENGATRWNLTEQYLSRRIFLYHDHTLVSASGHPVSWFHTTMLDVAALPKNADGESVFKMSYNNRTEFNVCYDVAGVARVRMAKHPYGADNHWSSWYPLTPETTYHLNEVSGGPEEELIDGVPFRNKHEVHISGGYVSLFCMFDPAPVGMENHRTGEYTDYGALEQYLNSPEYGQWLTKMRKLDQMCDSLSLARARNLHETSSAEWEVYKAGHEATARAQQELMRVIRDNRDSRRHAVEPWLEC